MQLAVIEYARSILGWKGKSLLWVVCCYVYVISLGGAGENEFCPFRGQVQLTPSNLNPWQLEAHASSNQNN